MEEVEAYSDSNSRKVAMTLNLLCTHEKKTAKIYDGNLTVTR